MAAGSQTWRAGSKAPMAIWNAINRMGGLPFRFAFRVAGHPRSARALEESVRIVAPWG